MESCYYITCRCGKDAYYAYNNCFICDECGYEIHTSLDDAEFNINKWNSKQPDIKDKVIHSIQKKCKKGVGLALHCQIALQHFIEDTTTDVADCVYASILYQWLGVIGDFKQMSHMQYTFILGALRKYTPDTDVINTLIAERLL